MMLLHEDLYRDEEEFVESDLEAEHKADSEEKRLVEDPAERALESVHVEIPRILPAEVVEAEEKRREVEEEETTAEEAAVAARQELVPVYLIAFDLPSMSLAIMTKEFEHLEGTSILKEITFFEHEVANRLSALRKAFTRELEEYAEPGPFGDGCWVAIDDRAVQVANRWREKFREEIRKILDNYIAKKIEEAQDEKLKKLYSKLYRKILSRLDTAYRIDVYRVYLEPEDAKRLLQGLLFRLSSKAEELRRKIQEAEEKKRKREASTLNSKLLKIELKLRKLRERYGSLLQEAGEEEEEKREQDSE